jgi:hypothetical protein
MTTGWPTIVVSRWPTMRASVSVLPPAGHGTITRIGFVGKSAAATLSVSAAATRPTQHRKIFMRLPSIVFLGIRRCRNISVKASLRDDILNCNPHLISSREKRQ